MGRVCRLLPLVGAGVPVEAETAVSLLPLLTGRLPGRHVAGILAALDDPDTLRDPVACADRRRRDPDFSDERMWRGPVWVNVNALLAEGLAVSGHPERRARSSSETLRLVMHAGGPHEYFNPSRAESADRDHRVRVVGRAVRRSGGSGQRLRFAPNRGHPASRATIRDESRPHSMSKEAAAAAAAAAAVTL